MKSRIYFFPMVALMAVLLWAGCKTGGESGGGAGSSDKVSLEVRLTPGMVYKQVTKTEQSSEQSVMGMKTKTKSVTEIFLKNEVMSVDAEGTADVKCTYERVKMEADNGMAGKSSFDSDKEGGEAPMQAQGYTALVGRSISFKIDKRGTVVAVSGVDSLFDVVLGKVAGDNAGGPEMEVVKKTLKASFGDEGMKSMMQTSSIMYPEALVAEGDTWGKKISSMGAMPLKMDVTYKVDHIDGDKVVLSFEGTIGTDKEKGLDLGIVSMQMDLSGDYKGTSEISRKTGMVLSSTVTQDMSGKMGMMGMQIPMSIEQVITVNPY